MVTPGIYGYLKQVSICENIDGCFCGNKVKKLSLFHLKKEQQRKKNKSIQANCSRCLVLYSQQMH